MPHPISHLEGTASLTATSTLAAAATATATATATRFNLFVYILQARELLGFSQHVSD